MSSIWAEKTQTGGAGAAGLLQGHLSLCMWFLRVVFPRGSFRYLDTWWLQGPRPIRDVDVCASYINLTFFLTVTLTILDV